VQLSSRTSNALNALYLANKYVLSKRQKASVLIAGSQIKSGREFQIMGPAIEKPTAVRVEMEARYCK